MRLLIMLVLVAGVAACDRAAAPRPFTLGPGCWHSRPVDGYGVVVRAHYPDCTKQNLDSLRAAGWTITWDTTWID